MTRINDRRPLQYGSAEFRKLQQLAPKGVISGKHISWGSWRTTIITRIQADFRAGLSLTEQAVSAKDKKFVTGARLVFGNWHKAFDESIQPLLDAIGPGFTLQYSKIKPFDKVGKYMVIEHLIALKATGFEMIPISVLNEHTKLFISCYLHFGSFEEAMNATKDYHRFIDVQKDKASS